MKQIQGLKGMIGLEIHTYIVTKEKLFCRCLASRERGLRQNINICPICTGQPGAKPMLPNEEAVKQAIRIGLMLECKINSDLKWQRKHYDWPDLPKGYQNTISGGATGVGVNGKFFGIRIRSMHLEEDPASWEPETGCVDYNRSGLPLVEIITEPDFETAEEVVEWLKKLLHSLAYLKSVDSNAGIKVDVNVNLENVTFSSPEILKKQQKISGMPGRTERVEIKNLNSIENISRAIEYEFERQMREGGERETRRFDDVSGKTIRMRGKEEQDDYRFISDPDLQDIILDSKVILELKKDLPESPEEKLDKVIKKFKIGKEDAGVLTKHIDIAEFFEAVVERGIEPKLALHWVTIELFRFLNYNKTSLNSNKLDLKLEHFVELLESVKSGKISVLQGKQILNKFYPKSFSLKNVEGRITDKKELEKIAKEVINGNRKAAADYKNGDKNALNFLIGEIMRKTNRRADFALARRVLEDMLK